MVRPKKQTNDFELDDLYLDDLFELGNIEPIHVKDGIQIQR